MENVSFKVKKGARNAFSSSLEMQMADVFPMVSTMAPYEILIWQTVKKFNLWEKVIVDKSVRIKAWIAIPFLYIKLQY